VRNPGAGIEETQWQNIASFIVSGASPRGVPPDFGGRRNFFTWSLGWASPAIVIALIWLIFGFGLPRDQARGARFESTASCLRRVRQAPTTGRQVGPWRAVTEEARRLFGSDGFVAPPNGLFGWDRVASMSATMALMSAATEDGDTEEASGNRGQQSGNAQRCTRQDQWRTSD
jgi:hypothetical protein